MGGRAILGRIANALNRCLAAPESLSPEPRAPNPEPRTPNPEPALDTKGSAVYTRNGLRVQGRRCESVADPPL